MDGQPIYADQALELLADTDSRIIARDVIDGPETDTTIICTWFLVFDHGTGDGPPVLWETTITGGSLDRFAQQYTSREAGEHGHQAILTDVQGPGGSKGRHHR